MDLEKTLQSAILDTYKELQVIFMGNENIKLIFNKIDKLIEDIKEDDGSFYERNTKYEQIINLICLTYSQNRIVTDKLKYSINDIDLYKLKKLKLKVDQILHYEKLDKYKPMSTVDFITKSKDLFGITDNDFDYTLLISNGIVKKEPGQKIIDFKIKNTRCVDYDIRKLVDREYITKNYNHTNKCGINKLMIERYQTITMYDDNKEDTPLNSTPIIPIKDIKKENKLYQTIDDKHVRELVPIRFYQMGDSDNLMDYNDINLIQQIVTHLESFEITLLRTNEYNREPRKKKENNFSGKTGVIETYLRTNSIEDSLWKAYNSMIIDEESAVKLASSIYGYSHALLKNRVGKRFIHDAKYVAKLDDIIQV